MTTTEAGIDQRAMTDLGPFAAEAAALPGGVGDLARVVQGLMLHVFWAERYGVTLSEERRAEVQIRPAARMLQKALELDGSPLAVARPPERRVVGNCRDHSVLLTAFLQARGVASRARCGFATYFEPGKYVDHWVGEYWNGERWVLVDAQLDALQREALRIDFNPLDVPRDRFMVAGESWLECRAGRRDPEAHGILDMSGMWFIRGNVVRDALSLCGLPVLPWDVWGLIGRQDAEEDPECLALTDALARECSVDPPPLARVQALVRQHESELLPPDPQALLA